MKTGMHAVLGVGQTVPRSWASLNWLPWCAIYITSEGGCTLIPEILEQSWVTPTWGVAPQPVLIQSCSVRIDVWQRLHEQKIHHVAQLQHLVCHHDPCSFDVCTYEVEDQQAASLWKVQQNVLKGSRLRKRLEYSPQPKWATRRSDKPLNKEDIDQI